MSTRLTSNPLQEFSKCCWSVTLRVSPPPSQPPVALQHCAARSPRPQLCTKGEEAGPEGGGLADRYSVAKGKGKVPQENGRTEANGSCWEACPGRVKIPSILGKIMIHLV